MATPALETISLEEFDRRIEANNERLLHELAAAQERVRKLENLLVRKQVFSQRLTQMLAEIEREENEIAALENGLRSPRTSARRSPAPKKSL